MIEAKIVVPTSDGCIAILEKKVDLDEFPDHSVNYKYDANSLKVILGENEVEIRLPHSIFGRFIEAGGTVHLYDERDGYVCSYVGGVEVAAVEFIKAQGVAEYLRSVGNSGHQSSHAANTFL